MRHLLALVFVLLLAPAVLGQAIHGMVTMKSGKVLVGQIVQIQEDRVQLRVSEGLLSIDRSKIASIEEVDSLGHRESPVAAPLGETLEDASDEEGEDAAATGSSSLDQPEESEGQPLDVSGESSEPALSTRAHVGDVGGPDIEVSRLIDRYLWFVPQKQGHRLTLGAALFLCLTLIVHLSSKMANFENLTFGRSFGVAALLFVVLAIEITMAPVHPGIVAGICFVNIVLWFVFVQLVYRSGMYPAVVMLVSFMLASMVGVLTLEVLGFVVQRTMLA